MKDSSIAECTTDARVNLSQHEIEVYRAVETSCSLCKLACQTPLNEKVIYKVDLKLHL